MRQAAVRTLKGPRLTVKIRSIGNGAARPQAARWLTEGHAEQTPEIGPQLSHLDCLVKVRGPAIAIYFSSRIERGLMRDPTGRREPGRPRRTPPG